jgi:hypothetical protein
MLVKKSNITPRKKHKRPETKKKVEKITVATFVPAEYEIAPVKFEVFRQLLKELNLRWTTYKNESTCQRCRDGPVKRQLLILLEKECAELVQGIEIMNVKRLSEAMKTQEYQKLDSQRAKLTSYLAQYDDHRRDLETARKYALGKKSNMKVREVFVTRDFVNHHDHDGDHVKCLILVLEFYLKEGGELQVLKIRHYCSDLDTLTTNFGYMLDVWRYQLHPKDEKHPGFFEAFDIIWVAGDHGGHFSSAGAMIEESKFYRVFKKELRLVFFPAYHAHGRADAAGAEDKK